MAFPITTDVDISSWCYSLSKKGLEGSTKNWEMEVEWACLRGDAGRAIKPIGVKLSPLGERAAAFGFALADAAPFDWGRIAYTIGPIFLGTAFAIRDKA